MATVSTLLTNLGSNLNDPNQEWATQAKKLVRLNEAQREVVSRVLAFGGKYQGVFDLLSEITEKEAIAVGSGGFALSGLANRTMLRNGYVNSRVTVDGEFKYPVRISVDKIGMTQNSFLEGSDEDPICWIESNSFFLQMDTLPQTVTLWYVGEPYELVASGASGSGPTQTVATPDLNVAMHDLLVKVAERDFRRARGAPEDFVEAKELEAQVNTLLFSLIRGDQAEPKSSTVGQFERDEEEEINV